MHTRSKVMTRLQQILYVLGVVGWVVFVTLDYRRQLHEGFRRGAGEVAIQISLGPLAMGLFVATASWITGGRLRDAFSWIALCVSLTLLIAWPIVKFMEDFAGAGLGLIVIMLVTAALSGLVYGAVTWLLRHPTDATPTTICEASLPPSVTSKDSHVASRSRSSFAPGLLWFTLGLLLALGSTFLAGWISYGFVDRGPVTMSTEWGGTIHEYDRIVDGVTGLLIVIVGWVAGLGGMRYQVPRPLSMGIIAAATLLGILFAWPGR